MTYSNFQINYSHHKTPKWRKMVDLLHAIVQTRVTTIVLLSHKLVANVLQHYELLCMLPPKRNTFFSYYDSYIHKGQNRKLFCL